MTARPFQLRAKPRKLESPIQEKCVVMLRAYMPDEVWWTASLSGVKLHGAAIGAANRGGLQRGGPDFSFIFPDGVTRYIEMKYERQTVFDPKAPKGKLTKEQDMLQGYLKRKMRVCHSWPEMRAVLESWLDLYGLRFLTERESLQRYAARREAERMAKVKPLRKRLAHAST